MDSLSDEILITEVFPRLDLDILKNLTLVSKRLNQICLDETLWRFKTERESPARIKESDLTWREFYCLMATGINLPLYYSGDRIATIPYHPRLIQSLVKLVEPYILQMCQSERVRIVLIDSKRIPFLTVQWPALTINTLPGDRIPEKILFFKEKSRILSELISEHGRPPVYGMYRSNKLQLIDNRSGQSHFRPFESWGYCDLVEILWLFGVKAPNPHQVERAIKRRLVEEAFQLDRATEEQVEFYFSWLVSNISRVELSEVILEKLSEIGHLL